MNEAPRPKFPEEITRYYQETAEEGRLAAGPSQLEFARTKEIVLRYLPPAPATILDNEGCLDWHDSQRGTKRSCG